MKGKITVAFILALIASVLPDIIIREYLGRLPGWLNMAKIIFLLSISVVFLFVGVLRELSKFSILLASVLIVQIISNILSATRFWRITFDVRTFTGNVGGNILLKFISIIPIVCLLFIMPKSTERFYLCRGNLSVKADKITWLGIKGESISWKKLSIISAVLISLGTALLTILTAPNLSIFKGTDRFFTYLPFIILFAIANSFCEGVIYRSAVMGTLREALPKKYVVLIAAVFFGIPHYYGVPSGILGAIMSSVLGWYMCRSMYETKGFASSWIIHFAQDAIVFSTMCLLGNLV